MPGPDRALLRFVRGLVAGRNATRHDACFVLAGPPPVSLDAGAVRALVADGVLAGDAESCRATPRTAGWLKRQLLDADAFAAQHRIEEVRPDGGTVNLAESPLARLATAVAGETNPFLERHQVEAGERVRLLAQRAQLQPRLTMSYSDSKTAHGRGQAADISDMAADARRALAEIPKILPRECADVVLDVCGLLKGLQLVERERNWPRRSAKLVLRIGLEQLARHYGLASHAVGRESRRRHAWMEDGARPLEFG